jgi:hypothetical protein
MFDPFQIATDGINPSWNPWNIAIKGFGFEVEVIVVPPDQPAGSGGGGWYNDRTVWEVDQKYTVIVRIKRNGKTWEQQSLVSPLTIKSLEKVIASFRRMTKSTVNVFASIKRILYSDIFVRVKKK